MKKIIFLLSTLFCLLIFLAGCGPTGVVVNARPYPPPMYERPVQPYPNYIWITGEWVYEGRGYVYRHGYWAAPRARYHHYYEGHWQQRRQGWVWVHGHWS